MVPIVLDKNSVNNEWIVVAIGATRTKNLREKIFSTAVPATTGCRDRTLWTPCSAAPATM